MEFKSVKFKKIKVFYTDELDGGGTTFGQDYLLFIKRLSKKKFNRKLKIYINNMSPDKFISLVKLLIFDKLSIFYEMILKKNKYYSN